VKPLLDIQNLTVEFLVGKKKLTAVSEVSLRIVPGETVCLVGESGSGKSVVCKSVMRLIEYENGVISGGTIRFGDTDLTRLSQEQMRQIRGKKIAIVYQEPMAAFDPVFTIGSQIMQAIMRHSKKTKTEAWEHAVHLLGRVGIPDPEIRMRQYPNELSGGMLQRAMIAMALSCGPELLIADEPTTALDVTIQAQILRLLKTLQKEYNMSILLVTHDLGVAAETADRIAVMYAGKIVEQAAAKVLFDRPGHPYTKGLLKSVATLDTPRGARLHSIEGAVPGLSDMPKGCRFHPRCPYATECCVNGDPPLEYAAGRQIACWHAEEASNNDPLAEHDRKTSGLSVTVRSNAEEHTGEGYTGEEPLRDSLRESLFEVKGLHKHYPVKNGLFGRMRTAILAVDDVSFSIERGETFGLVGESGSGKSTLGRVLLQLEPATKGQVMFQGRNLSGLKRDALREARRDMQMIFQDPYGSLNPRWKIGDLIGEPLKVHNDLRGKEVKERVEQLLEAVGLNPAWYDRYPHEFSGGQRQRIGIARAIALKPKFVLADEAVSALDVSVQAQIINLLMDLQHQLGLTYLFIAHGLNVVRHISDRIGVMYLGKLVEIAPADELFRYPAHPYTKALIASIPRPNPERKREWMEIRGEIPSPANPPRGCRFHTRCPVATAICRESPPDWSEVGTGHQVACHHPN